MKLVRLLAQNPQQHQQEYCREEWPIGSKKLEAHMRREGLNAARKQMKQNGWGSPIRQAAPIGDLTCRCQQVQPQQSIRQASPETKCREEHAMSLAG